MEELARSFADHSLDSLVNVKQLPSTSQSRSNQYPFASYSIIDAMSKEIIGSYSFTFPSTNTPLNTN